MRRLPEWLLRLLGRLFPRWQARHNAYWIFMIRQDFQIYGSSSYFVRGGWVFEVWPPAQWEVKP